MANGGKPGVQSPSVVPAWPAWLKKLWNTHPLGVVAGVTVIALALAVALIWPITDLIGAHDVGLITGSKRVAALQTAREAARTQLLTLGAGVFAAGALTFTARNFTLSRTTYRATEVRVLNERFATAAEQLGSDKPPAVRLAGVYAMAGLADNWADNRQTCIDVLCAYLRLRYGREPRHGEKAQMAFQDDREVRHTVIRVIAAHLRGDATVSWQGRNFDLAGVVFDGGSFDGAQFTGGQVSFNGANFTDGGVFFNAAKFTGGQVDFAGAQFTGGRVDFGSAQFTGAEVRFYGAKFTGGTVHFDGAQFNGGMVSFERAKFTGGMVDFSYAKFTGAIVEFMNAEFTGGEIDFAFAEFTGGAVAFPFAKFTTGGTVSFNSAKFATGGQVSFDAAKFTGATVHFGAAKFTGATVRFNGAEFTPGGTVDFSSAIGWSHPPLFDWKGKPPAGVTLPAGTGGESQ
jgi:uncharacterized protein YjbI with pentapeptide repeats